MNLTKPNSKNSPTTLEQMVANTCFCKLKETCPDKNSNECMRHRNIYAEFKQGQYNQKSESGSR
jgi:hypothetical protein